MRNETRQVQTNRQAGAAGRAARAAAFTLIELLVVIGIIVLLIGILVPALTGARAQAQRASTEALMNGIISNIHQFATTFNGQLPGPMPRTVTQATTANNKISGTQNLLLGLDFTILPNSASGASLVTIPGGGGAKVDPTSPNGPTDTTVTPNKSYPAFYPMAQNDLKTTNGISTHALAWNAFPVIVDRFSDPLPVLYFQADQPAANAWASEDTGTAATYYRSENLEYLDDTSLKSAAGLPFDQFTNAKYSSKGGNGGAAQMETDIKAAQGGGGAAFSTRGDFVLIAAGPSRFYGGKAGGSNDSIIKVGTVR